MEKVYAVWYKTNNGWHYYGSRNVLSNAEDLAHVLINRHMGVTIWATHIAHVTPYETTRIPAHLT